MSSFICINLFYFLLDNIELLPYTGSKGTKRRMKMLNRIKEFIRNWNESEYSNEYIYKISEPKPVAENYDRRDFSIVYEVLGK